MPFCTFCGSRRLTSKIYGRSGWGKTTSKGSNVSGKHDKSGKLFSLKNYKLQKVRNRAKWSTSFSMRSEVRTWLVIMLCQDRLGDEWCTTKEVSMLICKHCYSTWFPKAATKYSASILWSSGRKPLDRQERAWNIGYLEQLLRPALASIFIIKKHWHRRPGRSVIQTQPWALAWHERA